MRTSAQDFCLSHSSHALYKHALNSLTLGSLASSRINGQAALSRRTTADRLAEEGLTRNMASCGP